LSSFLDTDSQHHLNVRILLHFCDVTFLIK